LTVASSSGDDFPIPPADFKDRKIPIKELDLRIAPLLRIHRAENDPVFFNRPNETGTRYRFDAPDDEFGVLYAAQSFDVCFAETVIRGRFEEGALPLMIAESELTSRCISSLVTTGGKKLVLADMTKMLLHVGIDTRISTTIDYRGPSLWSAEIYKHGKNFDGIYFLSRSGAGPAVAVFSRITLQTVGPSTSLVEWPALPDFLDRYEIGVSP
jgi:hypothetical protein